MNKQHIVTGLTQQINKQLVTRFIDWKRINELNRDLSLALNMPRLSWIDVKKDVKYRNYPRKSSVR